MMKSEFIERTGFEPTDAEYHEIEEDYLTFYGDKDQFCKKWVKDGGIQRLSRQRVARIEELEKKLAKSMENEQTLTNAYDLLVIKYQEKEKELKEMLEAEKNKRIAAEADFHEIATKMAVLVDAFKILKEVE